MTADQTPATAAGRAAMTAGDALAKSGFTEYRKKLLTPISDITFPPGTVYSTPEGLRAEDEETRCAFDVQGGIYPIRESVFRASYELPQAEARALDRDALAALSARATPGRWYVDGPEFGGMWVVTGGEPPKDSFAVHPSAAGQPYAVLGGQGAEDAEFIVAAVNALRALLAREAPAASPEGHGPVTIERVEHENFTIVGVERWTDVRYESSAEATIARLRAALETARLDLMQDIEPDAIIVGIESALDGKP